MTLTYDELQIKARHNARVAQLREAFGDMTLVPYHLIMRLHALNADDWRVHIAERDSKKISETIVPALIDMTAVIPPHSRHDGPISGSESGNRPATPGVGANQKPNFVGTTPLDAAYSAFVGSSPGLEGRIDARRDLVGLPKIDSQQ